MQGQTLKEQERQIKNYFKSDIVSFLFEIFFKIFYNSIKEIQRRVMKILNHLKKSRQNLQNLSRRWFTDYLSEKIELMNILWLDSGEYWFK